jgi:protein-tyrosine phosphatase
MAVNLFAKARSLYDGIDEIPLPNVAGRLWLTGKHVIGNDPERALAKVGATTMVCLTEFAELDNRYPEYVAWLRTQPTERAIHFPIGDLAMVPIDHFQPFLSDVVIRLRNGEGLIVHCAAGIGRSGTTAVAVLLELGMPLSEALVHVRTHRPMGGPEVGAQRDLVEAIAAEITQRNKK